MEKPCNLDCQEFPDPCAWWEERYQDKVTEQNNLFCSKEIACYKHGGPVLVAPVIMDYVCLVCRVPLQVSTPPFRTGLPPWRRLPVMGACHREINMPAFEPLRSVKCPQRSTNPRRWVYCTSCIKRLINSSIYIPFPRQDTQCKASVKCSERQPTTHA